MAESQPPVPASASPGPRSSSKPSRSPSSKPNSRPGSDIPALADRFVSLFPQLDETTAGIARHIYRLLAQGEPVAYEALAAATGHTPGELRKLVGGWPGVYHEGEDISGFWGLTPGPFSKHLLHVGERKLYTWCAWDTLFIPMILGESARVETPDPVSGEAITLTVTAKGIEGLNPRGAMMSMLQPPQDILQDVVSKLCHYIHFFATPETGERWTAQNPGTFLMTVEEGFELGRLKNVARFGEALQG